MRLRVGSYNLAGGDPGLRLPGQLAMLAGLGLDGLALQECKWWDRDYRKTLHFAEEALGMRGFLVESNHHGCHLALFVRESARIKVTAERHDRSAVWWHALAHLVLSVDGFAGPVHFVGAHLAPASPTTRLAEAEAFKLIVDLDGEVIAAGDWNALAASEPDPPLEGIDPEQARRKRDRRPARALESVGLIDVAARLGDDTPTVGHRPARPEDRLVYRCDRVYTTLPAETISGYRVITQADEFSDHRPVTAEFTLGEAGRA